jgi:hypothetical protein
MDLAPRLFPKHQTVRQSTQHTMDNTQRVSIVCRNKEKSIYGKYTESKHRLEHVNSLFDSFVNQEIALPDFFQIFLDTAMMYKKQTTTDRKKEE